MTSDAQKVLAHFEDKFGTLDEKDEVWTWNRERRSQEVDRILPLPPTTRVCHARARVLASWGRDILR